MRRLWVIILLLIAFPLGAASREWYVQSGQERYGPYTLEQIREWVASGRIRSRTPVWKSGMGGWSRTSRVPELSDLFAGKGDGAETNRNVPLKSVGKQSSKPVPVPNPRPEESKNDGFMVTEASTRDHFNRRTNITLTIKHPEGKMLDQNIYASEITEWVDGKGNQIGSKQANSNKPFPGKGDLVTFSGSANYKSREASITLGVEKPLGNGVTSTQARGTLVIKHGSDKQSGQTPVIKVQKGEQFKMGDISFQIREIKPWALKDTNGNTRYYLEISCPLGDYQQEDYMFLETLELYDGEGNLIDKYPNQRSAMSDEQNRPYFMYNWILPKVPERMRLKYEYWKTIRNVKIPFDVTAPVRK